MPESKSAENVEKPDALSPLTADRELTDDELDKVSGGFIMGLLHKVQDSQQAMEGVANIQKAQGAEAANISRGLR